MIPFLSTNTPTRTSMSLKQITHSLPLHNPEAPLVQSGKEGISSENHMYNLMNRRVPSYIPQGKVTAVTDNFIRIKSDKNGKSYKISIYNHFPLNGHVEFHDVPKVSVGDSVKKGDVLAENNFSKNNSIAMGSNLRIAYMPYKGLNWKDALVISESAAERMAAVRVDNIEHDRQKHDIFSKNTFRTQYPMAYTSGQMGKLDEDGVVQEGMVVSDGDPIIHASITCWYTGPLSSRTQTIHTYSFSIRRPDISKARPESRKYRNPVIFAKELHDEMVRENLTRKQLAQRHGVSSDRITQWLCLLKLPEEKLKEIEALGDNWDGQMVTERALREMSKKLIT